MRYVELLRDTSQLRSKATIHGKYKGIITHPEIIDFVSDKFAYFSIFKYYDLSRFGLWLNERTQTPMISTEDNPLSDIPEEYKPELKIIPAVLTKQGHHIYFDARMVSPRSAEKFFHSLFNVPALLDKFGDVDVTMVQDKDQLDKILSIDVLTALHIFVKRPNPDDDQESDEARIARRMEKMGIYEWRQTVKGRSRRRDAISPDKDLRPYLDAALRNGEVSGEGYEDEKKVFLSSREIPQVRSASVRHPANASDYVESVWEVHQQR
jgi:hypothetical protein